MPPTLLKDDMPFRFFHVPINTHLVDKSVNGEQRSYVCKGTAVKISMKKSEGAHVKVAKGLELLAPAGMKEGGTVDVTLPEGVTLDQSE